MIIRKNNITSPLSHQSKQLNTLDEYIQDVTLGYISENVKNGKLKIVTPIQLQTYLANPDKYYVEISDLIKYEYITNGDIYQLHTLMTAMSSLNYKINVFDYSKNYEKHQSTISKTLHKIKYKSLTRDLISQLCSEGTVVTLWIGEKKNPYLYVFNDLKYTFPMYRLNGDWQCAVDMEWFEKMNETERTEVFATLNPYVKESDYTKYQNDRQNNKYVLLPQDRTKCIRINTLSRNQRLGLPMGTQALFDVLHKETLKNLEKTIADNIINNIAILTIGNKENPNVKISKDVKKKVTEGVKKVLSAKASDVISCAVLPEFCTLEWSEPKGLEGLDKEKFESINTDIATDIGISPALTNGIGGNSATAKFNLDMIYRRISTILEDVDDIFNQLLTIILGKQSDNIYFEFEKAKPIDSDKVLETLLKLHSEGFSLKAIIDMLPNIQFENYVESSLYEQTKLKLYEQIKPPAISSTQSGSDSKDVGAKEVDEMQTDSVETIKSKDYDKNKDK